MDIERTERKPEMAAHAFILSYCVLRQEDHEFNASLNYIVFEY